MTMLRSPSERRLSLVDDLRGSSDAKRRGVAFDDARTALSDAKRLGATFDDARRGTSDANKSRPSSSEGRRVDTERAGVAVSAEARLDSLSPKLPNQSSDAREVLEARRAVDARIVTRGAREINRCK